MHPQSPWVSVPQVCLDFDNDNDADCLMWGEQRPEPYECEAELRVRYYKNTVRASRAHLGAALIERLQGTARSPVMSEQTFENNPMRGSDICHEQLGGTCELICWLGLQRSWAVHAAVTRTWFGAPTLGACTLTWNLVSLTPPTLRCGDLDGDSDYE